MSILLTDLAIGVKKLPQSYSAYIMADHHRHQYDLKPFIRLLNI